MGGERRRRFPVRNRRAERIARADRVLNQSAFPVRSARRGGQPRSVFRAAYAEAGPALAEHAVVRITARHVIRDGRRLVLPLHHGDCRCRIGLRRRPSDRAEYGHESSCATVFFGNTHIPRRGVSAVRLDAARRQTFGEERYRRVFGTAEVRTRADGVDGTWLGARLRYTMLIRDASALDDKVFGCLGATGARCIGRGIRRLRNRIAGPVPHPRCPLHIDMARIESTHRLGLARDIHRAPQADDHAGLDMRRVECIRRRERMVRFG
ncbi:hypothetical protein [Nocardia sp. NPDC057455]|uniref:hypothetical protein n=1 Tax=Nocardia sp. NPDC057455 TaxID=3346138 RepID=UPI00366BD699